MKLKRVDLAPLYRVDGPLNNHRKIRVKIMIIKKNEHLEPIEGNLFTTAIKKTCYSQVEKACYLHIVYFFSRGVCFFISFCVLTLSPFSYFDTHIMGVMMSEFKNFFGKFQWSKWNETENCVNIDWNRLYARPVTRIQLWWWSNSMYLTMSIRLLLLFKMHKVPLHTNLTEGMQ